MSAEATTRLYELVQCADVEALRGLLKTSFSPQTLTKALNIATGQLEQNDFLEERFQICSELLTAGAQLIFNHDLGHYNLVQHCCKHGHSIMLKQVLQSLDESVLLTHMHKYSHDKSFTSDSPWNIVVRASHSECIEFLFHYYNTNYVNFDIYPAIRYTASTGNLASLNILLKLCHHENLCSGITDTDPSMLALRNKHYECAKLLINDCCVVGRLMCATDKEEAWEFILTNMTDNTSGKQAAHYVAGMRNWPCLKYILQERFVHSVDLNMYTDTNPHTMLYCLIYNYTDEGIDLMKQLLKYNVDINCQNSRCETPLLGAIVNYHSNEDIISWKIIRTLISHGCETSLIKSRGLEDSYFVRLEVLEMVLLAGAPIHEGPALQRMWWSKNTALETKHEIDKILNHHSTLVLSLKHLARLGVRQALTTSRFGTVPKLSGVLPPTLINYLMLPEIDAIEDKYGVLDLPENKRELYSSDDDSEYDIEDDKDEDYSHNNDSDHYYYYRHDSDSSVSSLAQ